MSNSAAICLFCFLLLLTAHCLTCLALIQPDSIVHEDERSSVATLLHSKSNWKTQSNLVPHCIKCPANEVVATLAQGLSHCPLPWRIPGFHLPKRLVPAAVNIITDTLIHQLFNAMNVQRQFCLSVTTFLIPTKTVVVALKDYCLHCVVMMDFNHKLSAIHTVYIYSSMDLKK
jgi:hypothetical protein